MSKTLQWIIGISVILIAAAFVFSAVWPFVAPNTGWAGYGMMGGGAGYNMMGGYGPGMMGMMMGGYGSPAPMHNAMLDSLATGLGLTRPELDGRLSKGETPAQIAASKGISQADFAKIVADAHKAATDRAVADSYVTQEQANWMLNMMSGQGCGMMGGYGNCSFYGTTPTPAP